MEKSCEICEAVFKVKPSDIKLGRGRFCSKPCANVWKRSGVYAGSNNPQWRGGLVATCEVCGVEFKALDRRNKYCTEHRWLKVSALQTARKLPLIERQCKTCHESFFVTKNQLKYAPCIYCCRVCANFANLQTQKTKNTDIELKVGGWLTSSNIPFEPQVPFKGIGIVDFVVGTTIIECDGIYWHTKPGKIDHDTKRDAALVALGYTVLRVSDKELKVEPVGSVIQRKAMIATLHNKSRVAWQEGL